MSSWAITYSVDAQSQRIYTFAVGSDNHLHVKYWNWVKPLALWADLGTPSGTLVVTGPGATTYHQGGRTGKQRIYAFVVGADHHLHVNYWTGTQWQWTNQGTPSGTTPWVTSAITFYKAPKQQIYAFVASQNGHLHVNYWNGTKWAWADQGTPSGTIVFSSPSVITYLDASKQRIYAFVAGENGHLCVNYWNGAKWTWTDLGTPPGTTVAQGLAISKVPPAGITFYRARKQRIYVFVVGGNGHLYVKYWNGAKWTWADQGAPSGTTVEASPAPAVITYVEGGKQRIYAFVVGADHHIHVNYWTGTQWQWADQGTPSGTVVLGPIAAITFYKARKQRIYAFAWCSDGRLHMNYWNGAKWTWADQGKP